MKNERTAFADNDLFADIQPVFCLMNILWLLYILSVCISAQIFFCEVHFRLA